MLLVNTITINEVLHLAIIRFCGHNICQIFTKLNTSNSSYSDLIIFMRQKNLFKGNFLFLYPSQFCVIFTKSSTNIDMRNEYRQSTSKQSNFFYQI